MKKEEIFLEVDGVQIRITHPSKILYPQAGYTKKDIIDYYLAIQQPLLRLNRGRPVVFIRYPHGAGGYSFFQKNVPPNHPDWMETVEMGKYKPVRYLILNKIADLIWFVQLHALEFHVINVRKPAFHHPDIMVFDIDPPEGADFKATRDFSMQAARVIETLGYKVFFKTSGKKGIHLVCPLKPIFTVDEVFAAAESAARKIVEQYPDTATIEVRKTKRQGKFLIDIYRNRAFQTFSMPLGTRATPVASVSMPLSREELRILEDPYVFTVKTVPAYLKQHGEPWPDFFESATELHFASSEK